MWREREEWGERGTDRKENKSATVLIHPFHNHLSSICLGAIVGTVVDTRGQKHSSIIRDTERKEVIRKLTCTVKEKHMVQGSCIR